MKFKTLKTNLSNLKIKSYFKRFGLDEITKHKNFKKRKVNQMIDDFAFQPELDELYLLHRYIIQFRRMTILEFGIGWSTIVMANALQYNRNKYLSKVENLRMSNAGQIHCLDNSKSWAKKMKIKLKRYSKIVKLNYSEVFMDRFNGKICTSFKDALKEKPDISIICNETSFHVDTALELAKINSHLFIEKPLSHSLVNLTKLLKIVKRKKLITMVGCNMRFHDGIKSIKKLLDKNELGQIFSVTAENGSYMPDWHPGEDYHISYASNKKMGGGVVLTQIHEIDYLFWFFGKVSNVLSISDKLSDLQLDVEDFSSSILKFKNNIVAEIHLDYYQKPSVRKCKIIGRKGKIIWNYENNHLQIFKNSTKKLSTKLIDKKFDRNKMYVEELKYFLNCVKNKKTCMNSIIEAYEVQKIAFAMKNSSNKGKKIF